MAFLAEDHQASLLAECLCNVWLPLLLFIPSFERSWKRRHDSSGTTSGLSLCASLLWLTGRKTRRENERQIDGNKLTAVESVGLTEALGFLSAINIDEFTAWLIRILICCSKYHVCWGNACRTRMILLKRLNQYPIQKQMCNLFTIDWCCWCGAEAYTCKKAADGYSPSSSTFGKWCNVKAG